MKRSLVSVTVMCLLLLAALSCTKSKDCITKPQPDPNVLMYCSFEEGGGPSLAGWWPNDTTSQMDFSPDVPPDGGRWSLSIRNTLNPAHISVARAVPALPGTTSYRFSFWAKAKGAPGNALLGLKTGDYSMAKSVLLECDSVWQMHSGSLTTDGDIVDSILMVLSARSTSVSGTTWFDLVKLEKLH